MDLRDCPPEERHGARRVQAQVVVLCSVLTLAACSAPGDAAGPEGRTSLAPPVAAGASEEAPPSAPDPVPAPAPTGASGGSIGTGAADDAPLTLEVALRTALARNRRLEASRLETLKAEDRTGAARGHYFPSITVGASESFLLLPLTFHFDRGSLGSIPGVGPFPVRNESIETPRHPVTLLHAEALQPLSQLYRIGLGVEQRELQGEIAREDHRLERQKLVAEVKVTYYSILQAQRGVDAARQAIELFRELDRVVTRAIEAQAAQEADGLEVRARLASAEHEALVLGNTVTSAKEKLNTLLGRDVATAFEVTAAPGDRDPPREVSAALDRALAQRPEVRKARLGEDLARKERSVKAAELWPELGIAAGYVRQFNVEFVPDDMAFVGLSLTWDLFDGGRKQRAYSEAKKTVSQAERVAEETESQVALEVRVRARKLAEARSQVEVTRLAEAAAAERLRIVRGKLEQDLALLKDVLQAQTELEKARARGVQAALDLRVSEAELDRAEGQEGPE